MAYSSLDIGKRRYSLTLTEEKMAWLHNYLRAKHAPKGIISEMVDEYLADIVKTFQELEAAQQRKGKEPSLGDVLSVIGNIMVEKEQRELVI